MKRFLKWFFGIFFFLVIVLAGAVVALPYIVNPNDYKDEIIAQLKPYMHGRDLQIPGDIKLSIFPWLGLEAGEVIIGNAEGFVLKPFMTIQNSKAHIRLLSLFSDKMEIGSLEFRDVNIYLQQDAEGRNNWSDLAQAPVNHKTTTGFIKVANTPANAKPADKQAPASTFTLPSMKVAGLHFYNTRIEFNDKKAQDLITVSKLDLDAGPIDSFNPIPLKGKFNFHSKKKQLSAASAFASVLVLTPKLDNFNLKQLVMNTNVTGKIVNNNVIKTSLKVPDLKIQTAEEKITAKPFYLKLDNMKGEGHITVKRFTRPVIRFGLKTDKLSLDKFIPATTTESKESGQPQAAEETPAKKDDDIPTVEELIGEKPVVIEKEAGLFAPIAVLKDTDLQGTISINEVTLRQLLLTKVKVVLQAHAGLVSALPTANLYKGTYDGNVQIQTKAKPSLLSSKHIFRDIYIGPLYKALYGKDTFTGRANFQGQFFSSGDTQEEILKNLNGDGQFSVRDTEMKTLDIKRLILKENYDKLKFLQEKEEGKQVTVFDTVRGTIRIKSGVAYNKDFAAISRRIHLNGEGSANLVNQTVNYTVITIPKKSFAFDMAGHHYDLKNKRIPTHFTGPWSNIDVNNELEAVLKAEFKQGLSEKKQAKEEEIKQKIEQEKEKLEQKYKNKLDEILNRK